MYHLVIVHNVVARQMTERQTDVREYQEPSDCTEYGWLKQVFKALTCVNDGVVGLVTVWRLIFAVISHLLLSRCSSSLWTFRCCFLHDLDFCLLGQSLLASNSLQLRLVSINIWLWRLIARLCHLVSAVWRLNHFHNPTNSRKTETYAKINLHEKVVTVSRPVSELKIVVLGHLIGYTGSTKWTVHQFRESIVPVRSYQSWSWWSLSWCTLAFLFFGLVLLFTSLDAETFF